MLLRVFGGLPLTEVAADWGDRCRRNLTGSGPAAAPPVASGAPDRTGVCGDKPGYALSTRIGRWVELLIAKSAR